MAKNTFAIVRLAIWLFFVLLVSCKSVREVVSFDTEIEATVIDDNGQQLSGAIVGIFDSFDHFQNSISQNVISGAIHTDTSEGGIVRFTKLAPNTKYWIAAFYTDRNRIAGTEMDLNNSEISNELAILLRKGSVNYYTIRVKPSSGIVIVYPGRPETARLPLQVRLNGMASGTIMQTFPVLPTLADSGVFWAKMPKGTHTYSISSSDCAWSGVFTVQPGVLNYLHLGPCNTGRLAFYYQDTTQSNYPISITLNSVEVLPDYATPIFDTIGVTCATTGLYSVMKNQGTYNYVAKTANGRCVWAGRAVVTANQCTLINLAPCEY